jgi:hypothetical protein
VLGWAETAYASAMPTDYRIRNRIRALLVIFAWSFLLRKMGSITGEPIVNSQIVCLVVARGLPTEPAGMAPHVPSYANSAGLSQPYETAR